MADLNRRNSKKNSEHIRQGIVKCLALEAECESLKGSLAETKDSLQKLEAQMTERIAELEGLMKILEEKEALIEKYKTVQRERQDLRDAEARRPRIPRETTAKLLKQDAQMYKREVGEESPEGDSLLQMACEAKVQKPRQVD